MRWWHTHFLFVFSHSQEKSCTNKIIVFHETRTITRDEYERSSSMCQSDFDCSSWNVSLLWEKFHCSLFSYFRCIQEREREKSSMCKWKRIGKMMLISFFDIAIEWTNVMTWNFLSSSMCSNGEESGVCVWSFDRWNKRRIQEYISFSLDIAFEKILNLRSNICLCYLRY